MPIYEYICEHCGNELEQIQKISEAPLAHCSACGTENLRKKISAVGFQLKGSGWYATDFKTKPAEKPTEKTKDSSTTTE